MQNHNHGHAKRNDMHKRGSTLEYDGIRNLNIPRIAVGYDTRSPGYRGCRPDEGAQRQRHLLAYRIELAEPHDAGDVSSGATINSVFPLGVGGHKAKGWMVVSTTTGVVGQWSE